MEILEANKLKRTELNFSTPFYSLYTRHFRLVLLLFNYNAIDTAWDGKGFAII